jgi:hypothetical protein
MCYTGNTHTVQSRGMYHWYIPTEVTIIVAATNKIIINETIHHLVCISPELNNNSEDN